MSHRTLVKAWLAGAGLMMCFHPVHAQMIDMMGNIGVSGTMMQQDAQNIGAMNKAMRAHRLMDDISFKSAEILTTFMGNYRNLSVQSFQSSGITVTVKPAENGRAFAMEMNTVNAALCKQIIARRWDGLIGRVVNGKKYASDPIQNRSVCQTSNTISLVFQ